MMNPEGSIFYNFSQLVPNNIGDILKQISHVSFRATNISMYPNEQGLKNNYTIVIPMNKINNNSFSEY